MLKYDFVPLKDITAWECAYIISMLTPGPFARMGKNVNFTQEQWEGLDPAIRRHFKESL